jgi:hypothetical protein
VGPNNPAHQVVLGTGVDFGRRKRDLSSDILAEADIAEFIFLFAGAAVLGANESAFHLVQLTEISCRRVIGVIRIRGFLSGTGNALPNWALRLVVRTGPAPMAGEEATFDSFIETPLGVRKFAPRITILGRGCSHTGFGMFATCADTQSQGRKGHNKEQRGLVHDSFLHKRVVFKTKISIYINRTRCVKKGKRHLESAK